MIELRDDALHFSFPGVHDEAHLEIDFQRTLRIPDDGNTYALPPGLGRFPVRHVDDFGERVPPHWIAHGGVMLPMFQAEALWLAFSPHHDHRRGSAYPFAVKIAAGKIDAVTGQTWTMGLHESPQDYLVAPKQPWLDGFCVERGTIRQFVAMPLGSGYSAEEQITGTGEFGGLQIVAYPMKREVFERRFPILPPPARQDIGIFCTMQPCSAPAPAPDMGLAPGGRMRQEIYDDPFDLADWDLEHGSRCFVHLANSLVWEAITGARPPQPPPTAAQYTKAGLPWFDYYDDTATARDGAKALADLESVLEMARKKGDAPLPENESVAPDRVVRLRPRHSRDEVREGRF